MKIAAALVLLLRLFLSDLIVTKDGKRYEGDVVEETDDWISVRTTKGTSRIRKDFIERWKKEDESPAGQLKYFVLRGDGVRVGEVVEEKRLGVTLRARGREETVRRSLIVESAPCGRTPAPSGPAEALRNPLSRDEETTGAVYALAFAGRTSSRKLNLDALVTVYLDPLEPHAARLAALELMGSAGTRAVDALDAATTDANADLRLRAAESLRGLARGPRARKEFEALVVRWLAKGGLRERRWAVEAATAENVTTAVGELRGLVRIPERALRLKAATALARLGGRREAGLLMRAVQEAPDEVLRRGFLAALREAVGDADVDKFAATLAPLDPKRAEAVGGIDIEKRVDVHLDKADAREAITRLAEENALASEVLPAAERYLKASRPVTIHLEGARLILAFRWIARQADVSVSVKPGKVKVLPGRMTADMSSADERAAIAAKLSARVALPGGTLGGCFNDVGRLAGINLVLSAEISEKELSMAGLQASRGSARELLERLCAMTRFRWIILDGAITVRR